VFYPQGMRICGPFNFVEDIVIKLPVMLAIGIPISVILTTFLTVPAMFVQMYQIGKIIVRECCCCL